MNKSQLPPFPLTSLTTQIQGALMTVDATFDRWARFASVRDRQSALALLVASHLRLLKELAEEECPSFVFIGEIDTGDDALVLELLMMAIIGSGPVLVDRPPNQGSIVIRALSQPVRERDSCGQLSWAIRHRAAIQNAVFHLIAVWLRVQEMGIPIPSAPARGWPQPVCGVMDCLLAVFYHDSSHWVSRAGFLANPPDQASRFPDVFATEWRYLLQRVSEG